MRRFSAAMLFMVTMALPAFAVTPDEVLDDPALEQRAREISAHLRCLVCQNQSIDDSDAELAKDLRVLVRERLVAGDTDDAVREFVVERYGEFVLLRPSFSLQNLALWATPLLVLLLGGIGAIFYVRGNRTATANTILSAEEEERVANLLGEGDTKSD